MPGLKQNLDCPRRLVVFAVFDIIDRMGGEYEPAMAGDIRAKVKVLGKTSQYAFAVTEVTSETSILHISLLQSMELLTEEEKQLALRYLLDSVLYHIDEV
ncbi:MAG TPA: hypothetical protein IAC40_07130 [Candidatus Faecivivens stercorigallinarum]|nr:hypothetical protein [Candidatus Faecivivens stercorigallinarum]